MKTTPKIQRYLTELAARHGVNVHHSGVYLRLDQEGIDTYLVLENLGDGRLRLARYREENGQPVADPEVIFYFTDQVTFLPGREFRGTWAPIERLQRLGGWQLYLEVDINGQARVIYDLAGQADLAEFTDTFLLNQLLQQRWSERGYKSTMPRPVRTPEELWARGIYFDHSLDDLLGRTEIGNETSVVIWVRLAGCQSSHRGHCYGELWQCAACSKTVCWAEGSDNDPEVCDDCWVKQRTAQEAEVRPSGINPQLARMVQQLVEAYGIDLSQPGSTLSLDMPTQPDRWLIANLDGRRLRLIRCFVAEDDQYSLDLRLAFTLSPTVWEPEELAYDLQLGMPTSRSPQSPEEDDDVPF
jgi:hypothetical protein